MKQDMYQDILDFHRRFEVPIRDKPGFLSEADMLFRVRCLNEELDELCEAIRNKDLIETGDALVDLVYFALGTAAMMGLPFQKMWNEVHECNMKKVRATSADQSKRGSALDVVKPTGWEGPNHARFFD